MSGCQMAAFFGYMPTRIEILTLTPDTRAEVFKNNYKEYPLTSVEIRDVYTIDKKLTSTQLKQIVKALTNPVTQKAQVRKTTSHKKPRHKKWAIEVGFLPGVTDNIATTTKEIIEDLLQIKFKAGEGVYSSQVTILSGSIKKEDALLISQTMGNPLIQRILVGEYPDNLPIIVPRVQLSSRTATTEVSLDVSDDELIEIGKKGIKNSDGTRRGPLALDLSYMKAIQSYFKKKNRKPTDIELESIAQTWSEHCKHTIFADPIDDIKHGLFKTYIKAATDKIRAQKGKNDFCVSVFTDNSGGIQFDADYVITHKVETHNSPSALDPFGGAVTGIVGVNRDAIGFGLGAKPVINMYGFCFANPKDTNPLFKDEALTQKMLLPRRIMDGVIQGVNYGGNCSGIPTPQGFTYFHNGYKGKPLVFVGTVGLMPKKHNTKILSKKKALPGDYIVVLGGRVGKDGIHGATFSSVAMDASSPATAVQIGDPITQKKLSDALVKEARDLDLYSSITDNGAGGLSCSVSEMAKESGGCDVELSLVPLKYPGLTPWEIWISESQERMTLAVPKKKWKKLSMLLTRHGVEATVIGTFTSSKKCKVSYKGKTIVDIDLDFLHNGLPARKLVSSRPEMSIEASPLPKLSIQKVCEEMLTRLNLSSTEFIASQYDHEVQAGSVLKPLQGRGRVFSETTVTRPLLSSNTGVVLSQALYPTYTEIDPYKMAAACIDTAIRNAASVGADVNKLALLDNFCWCSSLDPVRLYQLKEAVRACYDFAVLYGTPFISGKDSMFNDFKGYDKNGKKVNISIPPTLLISTIGTISDTTKTISLDFKMPGDAIYILGETYDELGGSEFFGYVEDKTKKEFIGIVPRVDAYRNRLLYKKLYNAIQKDLVASSISIGRGGLAYAILKGAIGGMLGAEVSLSDLPGSVEDNFSALFSESQGRILVTVASENIQKFEQMMVGASLSHIGTVSKSGVVRIMGTTKKRIITLPINTSEKLYKRRFKDF